MQPFHMSLKSLLAHCCTTHECAHVKSHFFPLKLNLHFSHHGLSLILLTKLSKKAKLSLMFLTVLNPPKSKIGYWHIRIKFYNYGISGGGEESLLSLPVSFGNAKDKGLLEKKSQWLEEQHMCTKRSMGEQYRG